MSRKRRNKENFPKTVSLGLSESTIEQSLIVETPETNDSKEAGRSGLLNYLKSHLWVVGVIVFVTLGAFGAGMKYLEDTAKRDRASNNTANGEQSLFSKVNPFAANPLPTATPVPVQLSKEYIYAGSRVIAVEDANASAAPPADLAVWRSSTGEWWVMGGAAGSQQVTQSWGSSGDKPVPGDYDGDGKTDFSVFRPSNGNWYIIYSAGGGNQFPFGQSGDIPAQADYDGDGRTDAAVFRAGVWYIMRSSDFGVTTQQFGLSTDKPAAADYDGDGKADIAVRRGSNTTFYVLRSSDTQLQGAFFGLSGDIPVSADYDGDGKADFALKSGNNWTIKQSSNNQSQTVAWQQAGDIEVPNDYDGDGKVDIAVWRNSDGNWYIRQSSRIGQSNELRQVQWGIPGDYPVPAFYRRK